jgi:lipopolysaccharide biosynthesis regulator YciM
MEFANTAIEERDSEITALRERLSYYQGFDAVIGDSVQRAADLFRSMYEERESIRRIGAQKQAEIEAEATLAAELRFSVERERFQSILMTLMDDASRMQRQLDSLLHRIAEAVAESKPATSEQSLGERISA